MQISVAPRATASSILAKTVAWSWCQAPPASSDLRMKPQKEQEPTQTLLMLTLRQTT